MIGNVVFHLLPGLSERLEKSHEFLDPFGIGVQVCFHDQAACHTVETLELPGHDASAIEVENAFEFGDDEQRVIQAGNAPLDVSYSDRLMGPPKVFKDCVVELDNEPDRICAGRANLPIKRRDVLLVHLGIIPVTLTAAAKRGELLRDLLLQQGHLLERGFHLSVLRRQVLLLSGELCLHRIDLLREVPV